MPKHEQPNKPKTQQLELALILVGIVLFVLGVIATVVLSHGNSTLQIIMASVEVVGVFLVGVSLGLQIKRK